MTGNYDLRRYGEACALLPGRLRTAALLAEERVQAAAEELRLRIDRPLGLTLPEGEVSMPGTRVIRDDLEQVLDRATEFSRYAAAETLRRGYVTARGGFRIGVCGTALPEGEDSTGFRDISSLALRIPRVREGAALPVLPELVEDGRHVSALVLSPPGGGKTTLLRDLVRLVSTGTDLAPPCRVSLVDERGELAAMHRGRPQLDVGDHTDVLDACPKALAVPMLLRSMNPQVIALDEVAGEADVAAVLSAAGCGCALLATVHAAGLADLERRETGRALLQSGVFRRAVTIRGRGRERSYQVEVLP